MSLGDQDRVAAIIDHQAIINWLLNPRSIGLLVYGNGRRHDSIAQISVAYASLIYVISKRLQNPTLYWYCGLYTSRPQGNPLTMLKI